jgi:hypothetical protein
MKANRTTDEKTDTERAKESRKTKKKTEGKTEERIRLDRHRLSGVRIGAPINMV